MLRLVEAVNLVEKKHGAGAPLPAVRGAREHLAHLFAPHLDGGELLHHGAGMACHEARERRLARARRP